MNSYYDDYYDDYNEFDAQVEQWKQLLKEGLKEDIKLELESLRKEVLELREIKREKQKYEREIEDKKRELELAIEQAEKKALKTKAKELLKYISEPVWTFQVEEYKQKKCDKCNEKREIHYTTPTGRETYENCNCARTVYVYIPTNEVTIKLEDTVLFYRYNNYSNEIKELGFYVNSKEDFERFKNPYCKDFAFRNEKLAIEYCEWKNKDIDFDKLEGWESNENEI